MPEIHLRNEFDDITDKLLVDTGETFATAALREWPDGFFGHTVYVLNDDGYIVSDIEATQIPMQDGETWEIVLRPQAPVVTLFSIIGTMLPGAVAGGTWLQIAMTAVSLIGSYFLRPSLPEVGPEYNWDDTQPQFFSVQSNRLRPGSRVPDVFGRVRVWPDLIVEPFVLYRGGEQKVRELYVVSNGRAVCSDFRISDEPLSAIQNTPDPKIRYPDQTWPQGFPIVRSNKYVAGIALPAPNENAAGYLDVAISNTGTITVEGITEFFKGNNYVGMYVHVVGDTVSAANKILYKITGIGDQNAPDYVDNVLMVSPNPAVTETINEDASLKIRIIEETNLSGGNPHVTTITGWTDIRNAMGSVIGDYAPLPGGDTAPTIEAGTFLKLNVDGSVGGTGSEYPISFGDTTNYKFESGYTQQEPLYNVYFTRDGYINPNTGDFHFVKFEDEAGYSPDTAPGANGATSILRIPGESIGAYFDIEFNQGLYQQRAGLAPEAREVEVRMYFRPSGSGGNWDYVTKAASAAERTVRRYTRYHEWTDGGEAGLYDTPGEYEVYFERITDWIENTSALVTVDSMQLIGLRARIDSSVMDGVIINYTLADLSLSSQNASQIIRERSFNLIAQREVTDWENNGVGYVANDRSIKQAILETFLASGDMSLSEIDTTSLDSVQQDLWDITFPQGQFNGVIDQTMTAEDQAALICSVGRISMYRRGNKIYFARLKGGEVPVSMVNARTKVEPERKTLNFSAQNEPKSIIVRFMDQDKDYTEQFEQYPRTEVPNGGDGAQEQTLIGVTDQKVAYRIAKYLWDQRINERDLLEASIGPEGILYAPADVIAVTDHLRSERPIDGEIINSSGTTLTFDQVIPAGDYILRIRGNEAGMNETGMAINVPSDTDTITNAAFNVSEPNATSQVGPLYSFTPDTRDHAELYYVSSVNPSRDGPVQISAVAYRTETYAADDITDGNIPDPIDPADPQP